MSYRSILISLLLITLSLNGYGRTLHSQPQNLSQLKAALIQYHDSGAYDQDISNITKRALYYLRFRLNQNQHNQPPKRLAIVLDIDETALSNYDDMEHLNFGGTQADIDALESDAHDPAIPFVRTLYQFAVAHHVAVFFVSDRKETLRTATMNNLKQDGYTGWAGLFLKPIDNSPGSTQSFKLAMRHKIIKMGYDIILNMGDQACDLRGGFADMSFKLPNPYYQVT